MEGRFTALLLSIHQPVIIIIIFTSSLLDCWTYIYVYLSSYIFLFKVSFCDAYAVVIFIFCIYIFLVESFFVELLIVWLYVAVRHMDDNYCSDKHDFISLSIFSRRSLMGCISTSVIDASFHILCTFTWTDICSCHFLFLTY